jgi:hypothetical protein
MDASQLIKDIIAPYERHGWKLRSVLLRPETRAAMSELSDIFAGAQLLESDFDALWFSRASHEKREAWELRLVAKQPYALFETFEGDDPEEDQEAARTEMENRMREYAQN